MAQREHKKLCLIDGSGYIYRAFYALPAMTRSSDGVPVNAVFGFTSMLMQFVKENPHDCIAVIFDAARHNFRNEIYPEYKATRKEVPPELVPQFPLIRDAVAAFNIAGVDEEGFEADDLIASYTSKARAEGYDVVIVTADKDLMQLMQGDEVRIYDPMKRKYLTQEDVDKKFGVTPDKVIEVQALIGDTSDNVPGVRGIGPKTAAELINKYDSLQGVYAHLSEITGRKKELLEAGKDSAFLSHKLVSLRQDAPLPKPISDFCCYVPEVQKVRAFLDLMGFKSLTARAADFVSHRAQFVQSLGNDDAKDGAPASAAQKSTPASEAASFAKNEPSLPLMAKPVQACVTKCIQTEAELKALSRAIDKSEKVAIHALTDQAQGQMAMLIGLAIALDGGRAFYIPLAHTDNGAEQTSLFDYQTLHAPQQVSLEQMATDLIPALMRDNLKVIGHLTKFDLEVLLRTFPSFQARTRFDDVAIMAYDLFGVLKDFTLPALAQNYLGQQIAAQSELCSDGKKQVSFASLQLPPATQYACTHVCAIMALYDYFLSALEKAQLTHVYQDIDAPLISVLAQMENTGILVDRDVLNALSTHFAEHMTQLEQTIYAKAGQAFNLNSPLQLGEVLFEKMAIKGGKRNPKTKHWITDSDVLEELDAQGEGIATDILAYRQYAKLKSTYTDSLVTLADPLTGRVHTNFTQVITSTGRLSSVNPNLQNIPVRSEEGREIRAAFVAEKGKLLMSADYSQVELRLLADVANVAHLQQDFAAGLDIHAATASKIFGVPIEGMDPMVRRRAKAINFGIVYGISAFGLARQLGISNGEAKGYIDAYFDKYPEIKTYMNNTIAFASEHHFVLTPFGRKCYITGFDRPATKGFASRAAINAPIQGGAADIIKMAMAKMQKELFVRQLKTKILLQVHDELIFEVPETEVDEVKALVKEVMENVVSLKVPLITEIGIGKNWKEAH